MIAHLRGRILEKQPNRVILDVQGVGYDVAVPLSTFYRLGEPGAEVALHVHTHVREDALALFGFASPLELLIFERLIGISGIGPKVALAVLSGIEPPDLVRAVHAGDIPRLTSIPGVGKKTAERILLELRDRLPPGMGAPQDEAAPAGGVAAEDLRSDLLSALANLGYHRLLAEKAVDAALKRIESPTFEESIRQALRELARIR